MEDVVKMVVMETVVGVVEVVPVEVEVYKVSLVGAMVMR